MFVGGLGEVGDGVFDGFDYVALGHLHAPQKAAKNARYSGSPLKYSFDEETQKKSVTILNISDTITMEESPVTALRDVRTVKGTIEDIVARGETDENKNDYLHVILEGPPVFEPMQRIRKVYPNALGLQNGSFQDAAETGDRSALRSGLKKSGQDDMLIFTEFMKQICGQEATDEDKALFLAQLQILSKGEGK